MGLDSALHTFLVAASIFENFGFDESADDHVNHKASSASTDKVHIGLEWTSDEESLIVKEQSYALRWCGRKERSSVVVEQDLSVRISYSNVFIQAKSWLDLERATAKVTFGQIRSAMGAPALLAEMTVDQGHSAGC